MREDGFTIVEMAAAAALTLTIIAIALALVDPLQAAFAAQSEAADMQQRLRVGAGTLSGGLVVAGAGPSRGLLAGPLGHYFAPVLPYRRGTNHDDPPGSFRTDTITLISVPATVAQTTLATVGPGAVSGSVGLNSGAGCPSGDLRCGFKTGMTVLIFDASGAYDMFSIAGVEENTLQIESAGRNLTRTHYQANTSTIVEATSTVYSLKTDAAAGTYQLVSSDSGGAELPIVDHLVALRFEYFGEPQPPELIPRAVGGPPRRWVAGTTYGPAPPPLHEQIWNRGFPFGENCTFRVDPVTGLQVSRLEVLGAGGATSMLVPLTNAQLTDGPWCPDATNVNRWDADLLRVRRIVVTLRIQAANAAMRGPASVLFAHGGTSRNGHRWLPDLQTTFDVTPRNLIFGR